MEYEHGVLVEFFGQRITEVLGEKPVPVSFTHHILHVE
jgi:hypothetical protein